MGKKLIKIFEFLLTISLFISLDLMSDSCTCADDDEQLVLRIWGAGDTGCTTDCNYHQTTVTHVNRYNIGDIYTFGAAIDTRINVDYVYTTHKRNGEITISSLRFCCRTSPYKQICFHYCPTKHKPDGDCNKNYQVVEFPMSILPIPGVSCN
jgi:hypothetical protein